eukprot:6470138-Amphidinium_carterae.1
MEMAVGMLAISAGWTRPLSSLLPKEALPRSMAGDPLSQSVVLRTYCVVLSGATQLLRRMHCNPLLKMVEDHALSVPRFGGCEALCLSMALLWIESPVCVVEPCSEHDRSQRL